MQQRRVQRKDESDSLVVVVVAVVVGMQMDEVVKEGLFLRRLRGFLRS